MDVVHINMKFFNTTIIVRSPYRNYLRHNSVTGFKNCSKIAYLKTKKKYF
jgi:hypothetical protein